MKLVIEKSELLKGINIVCKAVPSRTTMPILSCILVNASDSKITLTANDMEIGIKTQVTGMIEEGGKIALDAKLFSEIIKKLPEGDVTIEVDENRNTAISSKKSQYHIMGMDGNEFSDLPKVDKKYEVSIPQKVLKDMVRQTAFSIAVNDTNKMMTGELMEIRDGIFRITSLDGHRISIRKYKMNNTSEDKKAIIPGKTMTETARLLRDDADSMVDIYLGDDLILFEFDGIMVVSRQISGNYFKVDQMFSSKYQTKVVADKQELADTLERALPLVSEAVRMPVIATISGEAMDLKIKSQIGSFDEKTAVDKEGEDLKIGFNPKYLLDVMHAIDGDTVSMYYNGAKSPCVIKDDEESYIYLVLPVNFVD